MGGPLDVLLVEDDPSLREVLALHFAAEGFQVRQAEDGERALALIAEQMPAIAVFDVMLPGRSGLEVCAHLRSQGSTSGIVMLTARAAEVDVILGLDVGADDYVAKPCRPREVVARVRALARRLSSGALPNAPNRSAPLVRGRLTIDPDTRRVNVDDVVLRLTPTEWAVLWELASQPNVVHPRRELLQRVFDTSHEGYARNVDCHVTRLRRKLEAAGLDPTPVETVHGVGYRFAWT